MSDERDIPLTPQSPDTGTDHVFVTVKIEEALGAAAMAMICLISFGNVLTRYFTNISFAFTEEFSVVLLAFMTFVGASAAFASNEHIRITFFLQRMPRPVRWLCEMITVIVTTLLFAMIVHQSAQVTYDEWFWGETSAGMGNPVWLYTIWLPILSIAIILRVLGRGYARLIRDPRGV